MEKIEVIKKEIISEIKFSSGDVLSIGDLFDDGRIILFNILEEGIEVVLEWEWEGWSRIVNWDGELMD